MPQALKAKKADLGSVLSSSRNTNARALATGGGKMQARNLRQDKNLHNDIFVGKKIRFRRKMLKMSQKTLADHLKVSPQQIQKYETGLNRVSAGRLKEIADILSVPIAFFMLISSHNKSTLSSMMKSSRAERNTYCSKDFEFSPQSNKGQFYN
ncbi:hypothetical protein BHOIPH791_05210 [Bartonella henselae]|nr:hypothetical protein BH623125_04020 [Bartonella henselae]GFF04375.1 hypothetical protein BH80429_11960 [Bartonella henselae]